MAFLTTLGAGDEVACAIGVNPRRDDTHIAGTGQPIATPERLVERPPAVLIVMRPIICPRSRPTSSAWACGPAGC